MSSAAAARPPVAPSLADVADDLTLLARLHDAEPEAAVLELLRRRPVAECLALLLSSPAAEDGLQMIDAFLAEMPEPVDAGSRDELAADFAAIYLTCARRASPTESYWLTEDHLERQEPMFAVRRWYAHHGLMARDWRKRADDHLVLEIEFVAALLRDGRDVALHDAARFMDRHLLAWAPGFFEAVATRAGTGFYAGLALLSAAHLDAVRDLLQALTGEARVAPSSGPSATGPGCATVHPFVPGRGPGW